MFYVIYVLFVVFIKHFKNTLITNIVFVSTIVVCYIISVIYIYTKVGFDDWNFQNALPTANVSPFMFFVLPLFFALPVKIRKYFALLVSLLAVGMVIAPTVSAIHYFVIGYKFHPSFLLGYASHFLISMWSVYLVQTKQVELKVKDSLIAGSIIIIVCLTMLVINLIADTSFFGLSLRGKHNIYNQVITDNSFLSCLLYFLGLISLLVVGFFYQKLLLLLKHEKDS